MRRRELIMLLGGAAAAWPLAARAQQPAIPVVGFLNSASPGSIVDRVSAFRQGLGETGYVEGQSVAIEYRWAEGRYDRLSALAGDLVRRQVAMIAVDGPAATAIKAANIIIPIVFVIAGDPVQSGVVASLNRPGGNMTGVTNLSVELGPKRLDLLHKMVPTATTIAVLLNPTGRNAETQSRDLRAAARTLGLKLHVLNASTELDFDSAFAALIQLQAGGLLIAADPFLSSRIEQLAALTLRHALPAIFEYREFAAAGGLMSYSGSITDSYRLAGVYAARILKGENPANLPVQQSTKVQLFINLKTAKALGLTVPPPLLALADEVIE
jgi:putative ABC transport system substrate-binding protein